MGQQIKAIDVMNYLFTPKGMEKFWSSVEMQHMMNTIFKGRQPFPDIGPSEEFVRRMDEVGYEKVFIAALKIGSYRQRWMVQDFTNEEVYEEVRKFPDRLIGIAGYDPFRIKESLENIETAVKEYGFKGVYAHTLGFGIAPNDRKMYPCYAKCVELGIPFSVQLGHSLEIARSEPGRPIHLDEIALDFPELSIIGSHTGWPWCEEMVAMAWKHTNIFVDISAHLPRYLDPTLITFMDGRGRAKVLFGTNGLGLKLCKDQFMELELREETNRMVLHDNAARIFQLQ